MSRMVISFHCLSLHPHPRSLLPNTLSVYHSAVEAEQQLAGQKAVLEQRHRELEDAAAAQQRDAAALARARQALRVREQAAALAEARLSLRERATAVEPRRAEPAAGGGGPADGSLGERGLEQQAAELAEQRRVRISRGWRRRHFFTGLGRREGREGRGGGGRGSQDVRG